MPDEFIYEELSRSLADLGHFSVNGAGMAVWSYGPLYPILLAPAWLLTKSATQAYAVIQLINSLLMSSAALFAYLIGRRVLDKRLAFFVAVLTVLVPSMVYTSKAMTESLAYPVFLAAVLAITLALEQPSNKRQLLALFAIGVALLTRAEMIMLVPAFLTAIVFVAAIRGKADDDPAEHAFLAKILSFRLTLLLLGLVFVGAVALVLVQAPNLLGAHSHWLHVANLSTLPRWVLIYVGELDLYVGVVPFAAFVVMLVLACRAEAVSHQARAALAIAGSSFIWFVLLIASYSTQPRATPAVHDRYLFYLVPLVLLSFLLWINDGAPRPRRLKLVAAGVAFLAPAAIPFAEFLNGRAWGVSSSTVALVPWGLLKPALGAHGELLAVILCLSGAAVAAFLLVPPQRAFLLRLVVVLNFLFITLFVLAANTVVAEKAAARWVAPEPNWIDEAVGPNARVVGIWAEPQDGSPATRKIWDRWSALFEDQLMNDRVARLYAFGRAYDVVLLTHPFIGEAVSDSEGRLLESGSPIRAQYAVVGPELTLSGTQVAYDPNSGLRLIRLDGTGLRLR